MAVKRNSYIYSGILHVAIAAIAIFGLPSLWKPPEVVETPLVVDLVPIGLKTNPPPKQAEAPQPEPAKPEPPKAPEPKPEPPKPEPKPEPPKKQKNVTDELDSLLKSVDKKKPTPKDELDKLLKSAEKLKPSVPENKQATQTQAQSVRGSMSNNPNEPVSMTEKDAIRAHVERFWNVPAGAKDADKLVVYIRVSVLPDGTVTDAQIQMGDPTMMMNPYYQAAADSARRAVRAASPLPIPVNKYDQFKDFTLAFNPKFAAGR